jgi:hypothetical protein
MNKKVVLGALGTFMLAIMPLLWPNVKPLLWPSQHYYKAKFINGTVPLTNINIQIVIPAKQKNESLQLNKVTDSQAKIIAKLAEGMYTGSVIYNNKRYPFVFAISDADLSEVIDISNYQIIPKRPDNNGVISTAKVDTLKSMTDIKQNLRKARVHSNLNPSQFNQSITYAILPNKKKTLTKDVINPLKRGVEKTDDEVVPVEKTQSITAEEVMSNINIHVRRNENDKNEDGQTAYHYYLVGKESLLNSIATTYYRRNHSTFSEYSGNSYQTSSIRATYFDFKGYQWGYISDTYLAITLTNGITSSFTLKQLIYDN